MSLKICRDCHESLPLDCYYRNGKGTPNSVCKECDRERRMKRYYERTGEPDLDLAPSAPRVNGLAAKFARLPRPPTHIGE